MTAGIDPGRPDVWFFDVTARWFERLADAGLASAAERERADRLTAEGAARRLLARRTALRIVLARYLDCEPTGVRVVTAPGGKPVLVPTSHALSFSVAHSGDLYGLAVGGAKSVGLDVERHRALPRARSIAERWFGPAEAETLLSLSDDRLEDSFFRLWTGKEALAKRHGAGLRLMRGDAGELDVRSGEADGLLRFFVPLEGYSAAIASSEVIRDLEIIWPGEDLWTT